MGCFSIRPTRRNILFPVSRPTHFFSKKAKKKKKKRGRGFQMASCSSYALFFATPVAKERWAWPRHSTPTDRPAVERDSRDTGNKVFLLVGLMYMEKQTITFPISSTAINPPK